MPLIAQQQPLDTTTTARLERVLAQDPECAALLRQAVAAGLQTNGETHELWVGMFNGRPVAMLLLGSEGGKQVAGDQRNRQVQALVVHPATRQRGVATELLRQVSAMAGTLELPASLQTLGDRLQPN